MENAVLGMMKTEPGKRITARDPTGSYGSGICGVSDGQPEDGLEVDLKTRLAQVHSAFVRARSGAIQTNVRVFSTLPESPYWSMGVTGHSALQFEQRQWRSSFSPQIVR
jgi:hypothetical protein